MIKKIDHIGLAVSGIEEALEQFSRMFGFREVSRLKDPQGSFRSCLMAAGEARVELIEPLDGQGSVARFIAERGEGLHHVSLEVEDLDQVALSLRKAGALLLTPEPLALEDLRVLFVHPRSARGMLIELVEKGSSPGETQKEKF